MDEGSGQAEFTRTWVLNVQDLDNPEVLGFYEGPLSVTDHNLYTHQGLAYQANYYAGIQVWDIINPEALEFEQVAFFDTNPFSNQTGTSGGAWNVYPLFRKWQHCHQHPKPPLHCGAIGTAFCSARGIIVVGFENGEWRGPNDLRRV